ncbi:MAG: helix-turn-helix transcriptional regulator [Rhizobiaceae bacterium]|nr:helix-turn-helix transcriptional regulator [Rhizobiaceae bacterium]
MLCDPSWQFDSDPNRMENHRLWLIWAGEGEMTTPSGELISLVPGVSCAPRPDGVYSARHNPDNPLGVSFVNYIYTNGDAPLPPLWCWTPDFLFADAAMRKIAQLHAAGLAGMPGTGERCAMLLRAVLDDLRPGRQENPPSSASRLERDVIELANKVLEMPAEYDDISMLADSVFRSRSHFTRTFRRIHGVSPRQFVKSTKLLKARSLLQTTSLGIGEISSLLGYSTTQYFTRQYRSFFATTPGLDRHRSRGASAQALSPTSLPPREED